MGKRGGWKVIGAGSFRGFATLPSVGYPVPASLLYVYTFPSRSIPPLDVSLLLTPPVRTHIHTHARAQLYRHSASAHAQSAFIHASEPHDADRYAVYACVIYIAVASREDGSYIGLAPKQSGESIRDIHLNSARPCGLTFFPARTLSSIYVLLHCIYVVFSLLLWRDF